MVKLLGRTHEPSPCPPLNRPLVPLVPPPPFFFEPSPCPEGNSAFNLEVSKLGPAIADASYELTVAINRAPGGTLYFV
jgi:hypothetical protein